MVSCDSLTFQDANARIQLGEHPVVVQKVGTIVDR